MVGEVFGTEFGAVCFWYGVWAVFGALFVNENGIECSLCAVCFECSLCAVCFNTARVLSALDTPCVLSV